MLPLGMAVAASAMLPLADVGSVGLLNVRFPHLRTCAVDPLTLLERFEFRWQQLRSMSPGVMVVQSSGLHRVVASRLESWLD